MAQFEPKTGEVLANMAMTVANKCLDAVTCNVISQTKLLFTAFFALQPLSARKWAPRQSS